MPTETQPELSLDAETKAAINSPEFKAIKDPAERFQKIGDFIKARRPDFATFKPDTRAYIINEVIASHGENWLKSAVDWLSGPYQAPSGATKPSSRVPGLMDVLANEIKGGFSDISNLTGKLAKDQPVGMGEALAGVMGPLRMAGAPFAAAGRVAGKIGSAVGAPAVVSGALDKATDLITSFVGPGYVVKGTKALAAKGAAYLEDVATIGRAPTGEQLAGTMRGTASIRTSPESFGSSFPQAFKDEELARRSQASALYSKVTAAAQGKSVGTPGVISGIEKTLPSDLASKVMPSKAEKLGERTVETLDPLFEERNAFQSARSMVTNAQLSAMQGGTIPQGMSQHFIEQAFEGVGKKGGKLQGTDFLANLLKGDPTLPADVSVADAVKVRQRLNGIVGATKDFGDQRELRNLRSVLDDAIAKASPETSEALSQADLYYKTFVSGRTAPFGEKSALRSITQNDALEVVDNLVRPRKADLASQAMSVLDDEGKASLRSAWIDRTLEKARDSKTDLINPVKLKTLWSSYDPAVKSALLGEKVPIIEGEMDKIAKGLQAVSRSPRSRFAIPGGNLAQGIFITKDAIEAAGGAPRTGIYIIGHVANMIASYPKLMSAIVSKGIPLVEATSRALLLDTKNPDFWRTMRTIQIVSEDAIRSAAEQEAFKRKAGTPEAEEMIKSFTKTPAPAPQPAADRP